MSMRVKYKKKLIVYQKDTYCKPGESGLLPGESGSVVSDSFVTPWTVAHQVNLSMEFSRQKCWNG